MAKFQIQDITPPHRKKLIPQRYDDSIPREANLSTENEQRIEPNEIQEETYAPIEHREENENVEFPAPEHSEHTHSYSQSTYQNENFDEEQDIYTRPNSRGNLASSILGYARERRSFLWKAVGTVLIAIIGYVGFAEYFRGATVELTPRHTALALANTQFNAQKEVSGEGLRFSVMQLEQTETKEVPATGTRTVTQKASGNVIVYNEYSTAAQRLIKNTRFQSPGGKIYRINESIVVPGKRTEGGKTTPGSIEVTVYADEAGPAYNSDPVDFTIPGLKSDPERFQKMYARSKTPIAGGKEGVIKSVSDEDMKTATEELRISLETKLRTRARGNLGNNQVAFENGFFVAFDKTRLVEDNSGDASKATVEQRATLTAIVFDRNQLAQEIARKEIAGYIGEEVYIPNIEQKLNFAVPDSSVTDLMTATAIPVTFSGNIDIVAVVKAKDIAAVLAGSEKRTFNSIMASEPSVEYASADVRPFWRSTFPSNPDRIIVNVAAEKQ